MTRQQAALHRFLWSRQEAGDVMPSFQEMAEHLGVASKGNIACLVDALDQMGAIRRTRYRARRITVLQAPPDHVLTAFELRWCAQNAETIRRLIAGSIIENKTAGIGGAG